jgi:hypothetical protein
METFNAIIKELNNHIKISDFTQIQSDFDKIVDEVQNFGELLFGPTMRDDILPLALVRIFAKIDISISDVTAEKKKKFNANNSKSYNKLK